MRRDPMPPPARWKMEVLEVVPGLFVATRLAERSDYSTLGVDAIVDFEDWEFSWGPEVPRDHLFISFPMEDDEEIDPKVRELSAFLASLVTAGKRVLVHCTEGLNRSGVVVARTLMELGLSAREAIALVRERRGTSVDGFPALGNPAFVRWLEEEERSIRRE